MAFQLLITLDFSSHYMHMYRYVVVAASGAGWCELIGPAQFLGHRFAQPQGGQERCQLHHELVLPTRMFRLHFCPTPRVLITGLQTILFIACAGNELFFVALYLMKWVHTPLFQSLGTAPTYWTSFTWAEAMAIICAPVCASKNVVNLVQLWKASKILVGVDLAERAKEREKIHEESLREKKN